VCNMCASTLGASVSCSASCSRKCFSFLQKGDKADRHVFRKFYFRGIDLDQLLGLSKKDLMDLLNARQRRRLSARGLQVPRDIVVVLLVFLLIAVSM
jgi:hypothetical protein